MSHATGRADAPATTDPCSRCDLLLGLDGVRVERVDRALGVMRVTVSTPWQLAGYPDCGVVALSRGRRVRVLRDVPHGDVGVQIVWRQRRRRCAEAGCPRGTFAEQVPDWSPRAGCSPAGP